MAQTSQMRQIAFICSWKWLKLYLINHIVEKSKTKTISIYLAPSLSKTFCKEGVVTTFSLINLPIIIMTFFKVDFHLSCPLLTLCQPPKTSTLVSSAGLCCLTCYKKQNSFVSILTMFTWFIISIYQCR